jgi:hypothetical protein
MLGRLSIAPGMWLNSIIFVYTVSVWQVLNHVNRNIYHFKKNGSPNWLFLSRSTSSTSFDPHFNSCSQSKILAKYAHQKRLASLESIAKCTLEKTHHRSIMISPPICIWILPWTSPVFIQHFYVCTLSKIRPLNGSRLIQGLCGCWNVMNWNNRAHWQNT